MEFNKHWSTLNSFFRQGTLQIIVVQCYSVDLIMKFTRWYYDYYTGYVTDNWSIVLIYNDVY